MDSKEFRSMLDNGSERTRQGLAMMQALPLSVKIRMTQSRIREWVNEYGKEGVYVSFSGGKDSTVLLHVARKIYPNLKGMFVDVPTQYPELKRFALTFPNIDVVKPKKNFIQICEEYGFPLISKEVSESVYGARRYLTSILNEMNAPTDRQTDRQTDHIHIGTKESQEQEDTVNFPNPLLILNRLEGALMERHTKENRGEVRQQVS